MSADDPLTLAHPDLRKHLRKWRPTYPLNPWTLALMRRLEKRGGPSTLLRESEIEIITPFLSRLRVKVFEAQRPSGAALVWFHGGGFVHGHPETSRLLIERYVSELGLTVFAPVYSHAPERPFPHALEEGFSTLKWLGRHAEHYGIDLQRIGIGGVSAGGGLAASLAQLNRDRKGIPLSVQFLIAPMLEDRAHVKFQGQKFFLWTVEKNRFGWNAYLPGPPQQKPKYAVPADTMDLSDLPPTWIGVGTSDLLHEESRRYAENLTEQGVACRFVEVPGGVHSFEWTFPKVAVSREFQTEQVEGLRSYLG